MAPSGRLHKKERGRPIYSAVEPTLSSSTLSVKIYKGPFKCCIKQWEWEGVKFLEYKCYDEGVRFNVISVNKGWCVKFSDKKCYATLEWPLNE